MNTNITPALNLRRGWFFESIVVVNATMKTKAFQDSIDKISNALIMFVGDECHNQVTNGQLNWIPRNAVSIRTLSATSLESE